MQRVTDQVRPDYLEQTPPRPLPATVMLNLFGDHLFERPISAFLDPLLITASIVGLVLIVMRASWLVWIVPLLIVAGRVAWGGYKVWRRTRDDLRLLREGLTLRAHILRMRPHRNTMGEIDGALLDCAIPVAPRRTYVGSIWLSDGIEAARLSRQGRVEVICLPRTPGTWRIIEDVKAQIRYEYTGPAVQLPQDF